ncbi:ABC transporter substrate-binding protein [Paracoccus sp. P2]|uniref:ABC transporter substrate-binding protein n=2 Tax=Paracoccaceae TaxID=31989 RepID=UPI000225FBBB|nr:ABC transporter substrate-binding protein [Paracoccus aminovorans]MDQ7777278.1 ABC transporter substrate-binding protein [Paracoccus aminovorans]
MGKFRFSGMAVCALAACAVLSGGPATAEVAIGVFVPTTGVLAPLGNDMRNGFLLAAKGATVKGEPVRLIVEDTGGNPANGLRKAQKLVLEDKVSLLLGGASSAVTLGINAQAPRLNVPIITTNAQAVPITGEQCSRFMFRTVPHDGNTAKASAAMFAERPDMIGRKWFVVYHDYAYGLSNKAEFAHIPGIQIAGEAGRPVGTADWSSAIAQIQSSDADGIYLALAVGDDLTAFVNQARGYGLDFPIMTPAGIPDTMLQALGKNGVGMIANGLTASWMQEDENPQIAELVKAYHDEYGIVPGYQAIQAYAGMQFVLAALEAADEISTDAIIKALEDTVAETVVGPIDIRAEDHQGMQGTFVAEAVAVDPPRHGASIGWKPVTPMTWDQINLLPEETGCKGF